MSLPPIADNPPSRRDHRPVMTYVACAACVLVFLAIHFDPVGPGRAVERWGYVDSYDLWSGRYWALFTSVFVHEAPGHFIANLYWLALLGAVLEKAYGSARWTVFFVAAAVISSAFELGVSDDTGIGASGVAYALFGFLWMARKHYPEFQKVLSRKMILSFVVWLALCAVGTRMGILNIGNGAHVSGLLFGMGLAAAMTATSKRRSMAFAATGAFSVVALLPLVWCPWSSTWNALAAESAHRSGDYEEAIRFYSRSMQLGSDPEWALENMAAVYQAKGDDAACSATMAKLQQFRPEASH